MYISFVRTCLAFCLLTTVLWTQVPPGDGVRFQSNGSFPSFEIIDASDTGSAVLVAGIPAVLTGSSGGVIDPVTGDLWVLDTASKLFRVTLSGTMVSDFFEVADVGTVVGLRSVTLDHNGNPFVATPSLMYRVDRATGAVTFWDDVDLLTEGPFEGLTADAEARTLWAVTAKTVVLLTNPRILEYDLTAGPAEGTTIFLPQGAGYPVVSTSITDDGAGRLYVSTVNDNGEAYYSFDTNTGTESFLPVVPMHGVNALDHDRVSDSLHTLGNLSNQDYGSVDLVGGRYSVVNATVPCPGLPGCVLFTGVSVNDFLHTTQVYPAVGSSAAGFKLEVSANGEEGDTAAIFLRELNGITLAPPLILGVGFCDVGGRFRYEVELAAGFLTGSGLTDLGILAGVRTPGGQIFIDSIKHVEVTP